MEKRIKGLYIITMLAILIFLGMQVFWLYGRYELSLKEQEDTIFNAISTTIEEYIDSSYLEKKDKKYYTQYTIHQEINREHRNFQAKITWLYKNKAIESFKMDSLESKAEQTDRISDFLNNSSIYKIETYNASNVPSEGEVWTSMKKVDVEFNNPLTTEIIESLLKQKDIMSESKLITTDSMVWRGSIDRHKSIIHPAATAYVPYSELEKKSAEIHFRIPTAEVLKEMWTTLAVVALLSLFLIICLILQISTVLKLSRLDKMRNSFITTMIHELKRPISTMKMCVSGLGNERMIADKEARKDLLAETRIALDNLSAYFSKLRDITFNDVEQIPLNIETINLRKLTDMVTTGISISSGKEIRLINDIDAEIEISADRTHLSNILINLLENSIKYSNDSVKIICSASKDENSIEISVKDNGLGISSSDQKHIFNRFYRGNATISDQPGIGLGLAYVKLLVEAHGGEITVESTEGVGTIFTIRLPQ